MAIYHLNVTTGSRKGGQSAKAKTDYIARLGKYAKHRDAVVFTTSGNMPSWADRPSVFWSAADLYERANASLFREIEFALPLELNAAQRRELALKFAEEACGKFGFPYTLAIHAGEGKNPHCHLVFSERMTDGIERSPTRFFARADKERPERGGCLKADISSKRKVWLKKTRILWQDVCNAALEKYGHKARIDHRSNQERGLIQAPTQHLGVKASAELKRTGTHPRHEENQRRIELNNDYRSAQNAKSVVENIPPVADQAQSVKTAISQVESINDEIANELFTADYELKKAQAETDLAKLKAVQQPGGRKLADQAQKVADLERQNNAAQSDFWSGLDNAFTESQKRLEAQFAAVKTELQELTEAAKADQQELEQVLKSYEPRAIEKQERAHQTLMEVDNWSRAPISPRFCQLYQLAFNSELFEAEEQQRFVAADQQHKEQLVWKYYIASASYDADTDEYTAWRNRIWQDEAKRIEAMKYAYSGGSTRDCSMPSAVFDAELRFWSGHWLFQSGKITEEQARKFAYNKNADRFCAETIELAKEQVRQIQAENLADEKSLDPQPVKRSPALDSKKKGMSPY